MKEISKDLNYYLNLSYSIEILRDQDEDNPGWVATVKELPGCLTQADSFEELEEMITDAIRSWIEVALENGIPIPEPRLEEDYSGKFVVRLPKSLHHELAELSEKEEVSLNTLVLNTLAKSVGMVREAPIKEKIEEESDSVFAWPRISESAKKLLIQNGLGNEVHEINENMFAGWVADHIHQAQASLDQGDNRIALRYIQKIGLSLEVSCGQSPLISTFCQMILILENQIINNMGLLSGIVQQDKINRLVSSQINRSTETLFLPDSGWDNELDSLVLSEDIPDDYKILIKKQYNPHKR